MRYDIFRDDQLVGTLDSRALVMDTRDAALLALFRRARDVGILTWTHGTYENGTIYDGVGHVKLASIDPSGVPVFLRHLEDHAYRIANIA